MTPSYILASFRLFVVSSRIPYSKKISLIYSESKSSISSTIISYTPNSSCFTMPFIAFLYFFPCCRDAPKAAIGFPELKMTAVSLLSFSLRSYIFRSRLSCLIFSAFSNSSSVISPPCSSSSTKPSRRIARKRFKRMKFPTKIHVI